MFEKMKQKTHRDFIRRTLEIAQEGVGENLGGPFGCVIVENEKIIAEACNAVTSEHDPTAHAEIRAIRKACRKKQDFSLEDCFLYTSCEPCPMCFGAIYWAHLAKVYYAFTAEDAAESGFDDSFIYKELQKNKMRRQISFEQVDERNYLDIFGNWEQKMDKTNY